MRVERTYRLLTSAFEELMAEKPFSAITVNELCERAMVRRTTFYDHFANKDDFFRFYVRGIRQSISEHVARERPSMPFTEYAREMTLGFAQVVSENRVVLKRLRLDSSFAKLSEALAAEIAEQMLPTVEEMMRAIGPSRQCPDAAGAFARFYASGLVGLVEWWAECDDSLDSDRLMDAYDATVGRMLGLVEVRQVR